MDIRQLRYFLEIVAQGSLTRAAESLHVAQPALSLHLKNMEEQLGTRLLTRSRSGVTPTEAGELLLQRARAILEDLARTEDDIRNLETDPSGIVRIGLPGTISAMVSLPLILAARERFPRITLNITEAMSGFVGDWLSEGKIYLAVLYSRSKDARIRSELLL
ncbi:MAG: LysR family transcriptional regulator, partial [Pseudomonadota bacterium]|nr:LysR family transcriptional regulator [Pseudomonadota bacterium]